MTTTLGKANFMIRLCFILAWLGYGFYIKGGQGVWIMFMLIGIPLFIFYALRDLIHVMLDLFTAPRNVNVTLRREQRGHPDIEGKARIVSKHPDPTRPSNEDFKVLTWRRP